MELWLSRDEHKLGCVTLTLHEPHFSEEHPGEGFYSPCRVDVDRFACLDGNGGLLLKMAKELGVEPGMCRKIIVEVEDDD